MRENHWLLKHQEVFQQLANVPEEHLVDFETVLHFLFSRSVATLMKEISPVAGSTLFLYTAFVLSQAAMIATRSPAQLLSTNKFFDLTLIEADLKDSAEALSLCDVDDNGSLDAQEQTNLTWARSARQFDISGDGRLTHLEIAIRFAYTREEAGVQEIDRTVAERTMRLRDRNGNGQIDPSEITLEWPEDPDQIDVNRDGILTLQELTAEFAVRREVRAAVGIVGVDQGWAIKIRNRFDANRNGKLDEDEWTQYQFPKSPASYDEDKDRSLSLMELATLLAKHRIELGISTQDQLASRSLMRPVDNDFDGKASTSEIEAIKSNVPQHAEMILEFDTNKDGEVKLSEIEEELSKRREAMGYSAQHASAAKRLMQRHDSNRDQKISPSELREEGDGGKGYLKQSDLVQIDQNADERIDLEELARHIARESTSVAK